MCTYMIQESRDWRDVINQQRQPAPGNSNDRRGIAATSASLRYLIYVMKAPSILKISVIFQLISTVEWKKKGRESI